MTCDDTPGRLTVMRDLYDDVQMIFLGLILKKSFQSLYSQQLVLISELNLLLETGVDFDANLVEFEGTGIDVMKRLLILFLDGIFESANRFVIRDFNRKNLAGIIAIEETVHFKGRDRRQAWRRDWMKDDKDRQRTSDNHSPALGSTTITWRWSSIGSAKRWFIRFMGCDRA